MLTKVTKVGTSVGVIIPRFIAVEGKFEHGSPINIEYKHDRIVITRQQNVREGWAEAFAKYAKEGEDDMLLPDNIDNEVDMLL